MNNKKVTLHIVLMLVKTAPHVRDIGQKTEKEIKDVASLIGYPNLDIDIIKKILADLSRYSDDTLVDLYFTMNHIVELSKED